jgi:antirestriction protein ArdC
LAFAPAAQKHVRFFATGFLFIQTGGQDMTTTAKTNRTDIYTRVTDAIVAALEKGVRPWAQPWVATHQAGPVCRPLRANGIPYRGVNVLMLWMASEIKGYTSPIWMTYHQAIQVGGNVRKGEHSSPVVFANSFKKTEANEQGEEEEREINYLKQYAAFNVEQIDGLPDYYYALKPSPEALKNLRRIDAAERFVANLHADIRHGGGRAFYSPTDDYIQLPPLDSFRDSESYYATLAHEATHWTRHDKRLNRDFGRKCFGDTGYATEELVAELGSAFLCADLELTLEVREDHAAYIEHWLTALKNDKRLIFTAASHAQKALDYLHGLQPKSAS